MQGHPGRGRQGVPQPRTRTCSRTSCSAASNTTPHCASPWTRASSSTNCGRRCAAPLRELNDAPPDLDFLEIRPPGRDGAIKLTPLAALPEPQNVGRLMKVITDRWGTVPLIDALKESVLRSNCPTTTTDLVECSVEQVGDPGTGRIRGHRGRTGRVQSPAHHAAGVEHAQARTRSGTGRRLLRYDPAGSCPHVPADSRSVSGRWLPSRSRTAGR
jgi:hypothetical protein